MARRRRLNWLLLRVALALAAGCLFAPGQARASCGDYVHVGTNSEHSKPTSTETPQTPRQEQTPCHGPNCSGAPSRDPQATLPVVLPRDKEWAALAFPILIPEPCPLDALAEYPGRFAVRRASSIFHPPR